MCKLIHDTYTTCSWSVDRHVDQVSTECQRSIDWDIDGVSIKGVDHHSNEDAFSTHDLELLCFPVCF